MVLNIIIGNTLNRIKVHLIIKMRLFSNKRLSYTILRKRKLYIGLLIY
jgi:hypothetical protein